MKISARNKLKGKIVDVRERRDHRACDASMSAGQIVTAAITNEAVDEMKLAPGQDAYAIVKASDVMVGTD